MRDVIRHFEKHPPNNFNECLGIIGRFELNGMGSAGKRVDDFFSEKDDKTIDNDKIFW